MYISRIRVVSYNILADIYADSDFSRNELFPYCPPYALAIDYRKPLLLKEITGTSLLKYFTFQLFTVWIKNLNKLYTMVSGDVVKSACTQWAARFCPLKFHIKRYINKYKAQTV